MKRITNEQRSFIKQKLIGIGSILCGVISPTVFEGDMLFTLIFIAGGLILLFSKELLITNTDEERIIRKRRIRQESYR